MIPVLLYNFTAWMLGISQEVTLEKFVVVEKSVHLKMLSLLQDLLYLESKGQKPTPKHYCLGMMLHHLSGSSSIVGILNKLGHCSSRLVVSSLETALAQLQASINELQIPTGFCSAYTTVVWDNIDFSQETVSGKGTTHHTNGIIVQRLSISNMSMPSYSTERAFLPKRKHVVESQPIKVLPYTKKKTCGTIVESFIVISHSLGKKQSHRCSSLVFLCMLFSKLLMTQLPFPTGQAITHYSVETLIW